MRIRWRTYDINWVQRWFRSRGHVFSLIYRGVEHQVMERRSVNLKLRPIGNKLPSETHRRSGFIIFAHVGVNILFDAMRSWGSLM